MRRKTDKDILKESILIIISSVLFIVFGLAFPFAFPPVEYDQLYEKEITVESIKWNGREREVEDFID